MNGRVLFDLMYDTFVWPAHPFASRDAERPVRGPRDLDERSVGDADASPTAVSLRLLSPRAVISLGDRRTKGPA